MGRCVVDFVVCCIALCGWMAGVGPVLRPIDRSAGSIFFNGVLSVCLFVYGVWALVLILDRPTTYISSRHDNKQAFMALFATQEDDHRGLRGSKKAGNGGGSAVKSTTVLLDGLAMGAIFGYFTTLKFPGNQVRILQCFECLCVCMCFECLCICMCLHTPNTHTHTQI